MLEVLYNNFFTKGMLPSFNTMFNLFLTLESTWKVVKDQLGAWQEFVAESP